MSHELIYGVGTTRPWKKFRPKKQSKPVSVIIFNSKKDSSDFQPIIYMQPRNSWNDNQ